MTTKHKWMADEIDRVIDRALRETTSSPPPADLRARVMARMADARGVCPVSWRLAYAAAAAVVLIGTLTLWTGRERMPQGAKPEMAQQQPTNPGVSAPSDAAPDHAASPVVIARASERRTGPVARRPTRALPVANDAELYTLPPLPGPSELDVAGIPTVAAVVTPIETESIGIARLHIDALKGPQ